MLGLGILELVLAVLGGLVAVGLVVAVGSALRRPHAQVEVEVDEVGRLKERVDQLDELEQQLVSAGQSLGRVRRFLEAQGPADEATAELKDALAGIWLRRHDLQGRLRLAALRRRIPLPPEGQSLRQPTDLDGASALAVTLAEGATSYRLLAARAEDSARMLRQTAPADDANARWVGDAVEAAVAWRTAQVEDILRFAGRMGLYADRLEEAGVAVESTIAALGAPDAAPLPPMDAERAHGLIRLGLEDKRAKELENGRLETDLDEAIERARAAAEVARELARTAAVSRGAGS
jgi:hypothetical protein